MLCQDNGIESLYLVLMLFVFLLSFAGIEREKLCYSCSIYAQVLR